VPKPCPALVVPTQIRAFDDLLADPAWIDLVTIRWSDPNDTGDNTEDIAAETLATFTDDADAAEAAELIAYIFSRPHKDELQRRGIVEIKMADIATGMRGRLGWAFIRGSKLFLVVQHSAFEDNIPGKHLDDGRNAFTELQLKCIRSRRDGKAYYAFSTRRARKYFHRVAMNKAIQAYGWKVMVAGKEVDLDNLLVDAVEGTLDEKKTIDFHTAVGRGELDDIIDNLYPRNESGLGFAHQFKREMVRKGTLSYEKVLDKQVEPRPEAAAILQEIAPAIATGVPWDTVGRTAGRLGVRARAGTDVKYETGRTLDQLAHPGSALKELFADGRLELYTTGKRTVRWHAKIQGGADYGRHGRPTMYTLDDLLAMTPAQRKKAEKGYFEVTFDWGLVMLPGRDGRLCPWGVPYATWAKVEERLAAEAAVERSRGAANRKRDKKPLVGPHEWVIDGIRYAIVSNRTGTYELHCRAAHLTGGWKVEPGRTLASWRSGDHHAAVGSALADIAAELGDLVAPLQVLRTRQEQAEQPTLKETLRRQAADARKEAAELVKQADAIPELARTLTANGMVEAAIAQYAQEPELRRQTRERLKEAEQLDARADTEGDSAPGEVKADFGQLIAVAAGLMAYPVKAPYQLADAAGTILHNQRAQVSGQGLTVELTATVVLRLTDGTIGTYPLTVTVPNRRRGGHDLDPSLFERVARMWFTSPDAISFAALGTQLGWDADEVRRKVGVFLGVRGGVPKNMTLVERIPSPCLRTAILDCPIPEVRHAVWAALKPKEARVANYLTADFRAHIQATYLDPGFVWPDYWAGDTHVFRRLLTALCLAQAQPLGGVRVDAAARALGVGEREILTWSRPYQVGSGNRAPAYPATVERVIPFDRANSALPPDLKRVRAVRCPHRDCPGNKRGRSGGWCTVILRVPETARWAVLCPDCLRVPDPAMSRVRFPENYLRRWEGPRGFGTTNAGRDGTPQTVDADASPGTI
jgi:hypothetical protein